MLIEHDISLKSLNTFGIDVSARYFAKCNNLEELNEGLAFHEQQDHTHNAPLILGGGSNILFTKNVEHLVVKNNINGIDKLFEDDDYVYIRSGAGESWHGFVEYCIKNNYAGVENLSLIPGNVGAGPMQNIGAYGVEIKDVFHSLEALHLKEKTLEKFSLAECEFGYRDSVFKNKYKNQFAITSVTFKLRKAPVYNTSYGSIDEELAKMGVKELSLMAVSQAVIRIRRRKLPDPAEIGNAGSFFKNPEVSNERFKILKNNFPLLVGYPLANENTKIAAGWLIEQCGWKGYRKGDAGCHDKQALVLVNFGSAGGDEILFLSESIINSVRDTFGIVLQREVNLL